MNATRLKNKKNQPMLASVGLRVAAVAVSILALTYSSDKTVPRHVALICLIKHA